MKQQVSAATQSVACEARIGQGPGSSGRSALRRRLVELGLRPRKALGQHFLIAQGVLQRILEAADLAPGDLVLEVGPGLGVLTEALAQRGAQVVAVELDRELAAALARRLSSYGSQVRVVQDDARAVDLESLLPPGLPYLVVANLPYYAASHLVRRFLEGRRKPGRLVVMLQREVARHMVGEPGKLSLLGVGVQFYGRPRIVALVPPGAFYPPPKVASAIIRIDVHPQPLLPEEQTEGFFSLIRAGFSAPRKQLRGGLAHALDWPADRVAALLQSTGVDCTRRAESLSLQEWATLYGRFREAGWLP